MFPGELTSRNMDRWDPVFEYPAATLQGPVSEVVGVLVRAWILNGL